MPAALRRFTSSSTDSSASDYSSTPSSTFTPPSSGRSCRPTSISSPATSVASSAFLKDLSTSDLESLLAAKLAAEKKPPPPKRKMVVVPAPPAYPYPDFFLPSSKPPKAPKVKSISSGSSGRKNVFGLFGASRTSIASSASSSSLVSSTAPSVISRETPSEAPPIVIKVRGGVDGRPYDKVSADLGELPLEHKLDRLEELFQEARLVESPPPTPPPSSSPSSISSPSAPASSFANRALPTPPLGSPSFQSPTGAQIPFVRRPRLTPPPSPAPTISLPALPSQPSPRAESVPSPTAASLAARRDSNWSQLSTSSDASSAPSATSGRGGLALRVVTEEPISALAKDVQKVLNTATTMLSKSLNLSLVYLVALDLTSPSYNLTLLSSCGLPSPPPSFDPSLHFKALRAPEGGLLYQNTRGGKGFASGLLVPILEVRQVGYVMAGYTYDADRVFGQREMESFVRFAQQLEQWVSRIGRTA